MPMETNRNYANEPTVGINFFESIPPVGLENYSSRWKNTIEATHSALALILSNNFLDNDSNQIDNIHIYS